MKHFIKLYYSIVIVLGVLAEAIGIEKSDFQLTNTAAPNPYLLDMPDSSQIMSSFMELDEEDLLAFDLPSLENAEETSEFDLPCLKRKGEASVDLQNDVKVAKIALNHDYTFHNIPQDLLNLICSFLLLSDHGKIAEVSKWYNGIIQPYCRRAFSKKMHIFNCREETAERLMSYIKIAKKKNLTLRLGFLNFPTFSKREKEKEKDFFISEALDFLKRAPIEDLSIMEFGTERLDFTKVTLDKLTNITGKNNFNIFPNLKKLTLCTFQDVYPCSYFKKIIPCKLEFLKYYIHQLTHVCFGEKYLLPFLDEIRRTKSPVQNLKKLKIIVNRDSLKDALDFQSVNGKIKKYLPEVKISMIVKAPQDMFDIFFPNFGRCLNNISPFLLNKLYKVFVTHDITYPKKMKPKQIAAIPEIALQNEFYSFFLNKDYFSNPYVEYFNTNIKDLLDSLNSIFPNLEKFVQKLNLPDLKPFSIVNTYGLNEKKEMVLKRSRYVKLKSTDNIMLYK